MKRQSTSKLLRLMVAVFALFLLVMAGSVLSACGGETVEENPNNNTPAEVHKHTYGAAEHTAIAKCGSTGYDVYTCTVCGDKYAIVTAATGAHDFKNGVCTVCGISTAGYDDTSLKEYLKTELDKINESVGKITTPEAAHKHDFKTTVKTIAPTCLSIGLTVKKCECGSTTVEDLKDPLKHEYEAKETVAATCTTDGKTEMVCKNCNDTYWAVNKDDPAKGHDFKRELADKSLDKPANCITPELRAYKCANEGCNEVDYQQFGDLDPTRHTNDTTENKWVSNWQEYKSDSTVSTDTLPEGWGVSTSTLKVEYGTCDACGGIAWRQTKENCEHEWTKWTGDGTLPGTIDRTCEEDGWFNAKCTKCGAFANQAPKDGWDGKYEDLNTYLDTSENGPINVVLGAGNDTVEATKDAHKGLYKYEKTGHSYTEALAENWEVDRDANGKVITGANQVEGGQKKTSNTTHWLTTTCTNCNQPIVVKKGENGAADLMKTLYLDENKKPAQTQYTDEEWKNFFSREWHSWQLYDGESDEEQEGKIVFENGVSINIPTDARGPVEATCLDEGVEWYYCIDDQCRKEGNGDGRWIEIELPALGHIWEKIDIDQDPTCTTGGIVTYICTRTTTVEENGVKKEVSRCGHNGWDGTQSGEVKYDEAWATITFKYKADEFKKVVEGTKKQGSETEYDVKPFNWEFEWRTQTEDSEGNKVDHWEDKYYYEVWGKAGLWTATCGTTDDIKGEHPDVTENAGTVTDNGLCGKDFLKDFTDKSGAILHSVLEKFMPQAHLWDVDEEAMKKKEKEHPSTCYDGHVTIYKCVCGMDNNECCKDGETEGAKACPKWEREGKFEHLQKKDDKGNPIPNTDKFIIYGYCGVNHSANGKAHLNYEVTYCIYCYAIVDIRVMTDTDAKETPIENYRHFPFDREKLFSLMMSACPLPEGTTLKQLMEDPMLLKEEGITVDGVEGEVGSYFNAKDKLDRDQREEFVKTWIEINDFWFEKEGMASQYEHLMKYVTLRDSKFECFDCFELLNDFNDINALYEKYSKPEQYNQLKWALWYYAKDENGVMVKITDDTRKTFNACEYEYYSQYEIWAVNTDGSRAFTWFSSLNHITKKDWDEQHKDEKTSDLNFYDAIGEYNAESVDKDGKAIKPAGKHYLVPAKDYADRENFKRNEANEVTMDWVCVFCGNTFELQVKYEAPKAEEPATAEYKANVKLVTENPKMVLLVDMNGVKFDDKTLNERGSSNNASAVFQKAGPFYAKDEIGKKNTTDKNGLWSYVAAGTVIIVEAHGSTDICVAHRLASDSSKYFEGDSSNGNNRSEAACIGSKLSADDFADASAKRTDENTPTLFETIWAGTYGTAGIDVEHDTDGTQRLAVATRLDNLLREGGEIVVGGDLQELRKRDESTKRGEFDWDTITVEDEASAASIMTVANSTPETIYPLGTMVQQSNLTYFWHRKADGGDCNGYPSGTCKKASECTCEGCKTGEEEQKCQCINVPILDLNAGTVLDLNGHTLYANISIGAVKANGDADEYGDDGYGHKMKAGEVVIKNGKIVMSSAGKIQVENENAHLTLENVEISGGESGISAFNGATITMKNCNIITKGYAISSNNTKQQSQGQGAAGTGSANFELTNSGFISTESTAFFMPAKGNVSATGCEFYGYNMGVYLRGHDLEEKEDTQDPKKSTHAIFENCLFAKGDQAAGFTPVDDKSSGTQTKHYGALTIGNDNKKGSGYGSIKGLFLKECNFAIVHVEKIDPETEAAGTGVWKPAFESGEGKDHCDLNLGDENEDYKSECKTGSTDGTCTTETCCHRAIVLNIFGCTDEGQDCMNGNNECTENCGKNGYGTLTLYIDEATLTNLRNHAQKFSHTGKTEAAKLNPFIDCTFTDGAALLGKCKKLTIYLIADGEDPAEIELNWKATDGQDLEMQKA